MSKKDDEYYMNYAINISAKANCVKGKVGAIIIKDDKIISEGVNSVPNGIKPCTESSCLRKKLNLKSGENQELCFAVHAEQNALINVLNNHADINNSILYVTKQPCIICAKMLINSGVKEIIYLKEYPDKYSEKLLKDANIKLRKFSM